MPSAEGQPWPVRRCGETGPAVCLLHGFLGEGADWDKVAERLSTDFRLFVPDIPGHGRNIALKTLPDFKTLVDQLDAVRIAHGVKRWHLVGYSMGGRIALNYVLRFPARVATLTMVSSSPGVEGEDERDKRRSSDRVWADRIVQYSPEAFLESWYNQQVFKSLVRRPELRRMLIQRRRGYAASLLADALNAWGQGAVPAAWADLAGLMCPVLSVAGTWDEAYIRHQDRMARLSPRIRTVMVAQAGHTVHLEQPERLAGAIKQFIKESETYEK